MSPPAESGAFRSFLSLAVPADEHEHQRRQRSPLPFLKSLPRRASKAILRTVRSQPRLRRPDPARAPLVVVTKPPPPLPPSRDFGAEPWTRRYNNSPYSSPYASLARRRSPSPEPESDVPFPSASATPRFRGMQTEIPTASYTSFFDDASSEEDEDEEPVLPVQHLRARQSSQHLCPYARTSAASGSTALGAECIFKPGAEPSDLGAEFPETLMPEPEATPSQSESSETAGSSARPRSARDKWLTRSRSALDLGTRNMASTSTSTAVQPDARASFALPSPTTAATDAFPLTPTSPEQRVFLHIDDGSEDEPYEYGYEQDHRRPISRSLGFGRAKPTPTPTPAPVPPRPASRRHSNPDWTLSLPHLPLLTPGPPPPPYESTRRTSVLSGITAVEV